MSWLCIGARVQHVLDLREGRVVAFQVDEDEALVLWDRLPQFAVRERTELLLPIDLEVGVGPEVMDEAHELMMRVMRRAV